MSILFFPYLTHYLLSKSLTLRKRFSYKASTFVLLPHFVPFFLKFLTLLLLFFNKLTSWIHKCTSILLLSLWVMSKLVIISDLVQYPSAFITNAARKLDTPLVICHFVQNIDCHIKGHKLKQLFRLGLHFLKSFKKFWWNSVSAHFWLLLFGSSFQFFLHGGRFTALHNIFTFEQMLYWLKIFSKHYFICMRHAWIILLWHFDIPIRLARCGKRFRFLVVVRRIFSDIFCHNFNINSIIKLSILFYKIKIL